MSEASKPIASESVVENTVGVRVLMNVSAPFTPCRKRARKIIIYGLLAADSAIYRNNPYREEDITRV